MASGDPQPGVTRFAATIPEGAVAPGSAAAPAAPVEVPAATRPRLRVESIDLVRGLIMVIMALDHTRHEFHAGSYDPTDLSRASVAVFLTRLITHLCAPTFVFLAGTSAFLSAFSGDTPRALQSRHLLVRGLWLVLLEWTLVRWGGFDLSYEWVGLQVIWALGWCMVALAGLIWLPSWAMLAVGGGMVLLHNLTDRWGKEGSPFPDWLWTILHVPGDINLGRLQIFVLYPLIPWIGVMALGYLFGRWMTAPPDVRRARCARLGVACLAAFALLRATNFYGDARLWEAPGGRPPIFSALAFVNTSKYPPSLLFLLMTLGTMFLLLALFEGWRSTGGAAGETRRWSLIGTARHALLVFGRVPLFFYLVHLPLIHALGMLNVWVRVGPPPPGAKEWGRDALYGLPGLYLAWAIVILILYPLCARYDAYKRRRRGGWTRYL
jgi:uncharacterized membrane protein